MWICVCGETETRIWWREYVYLIMLGYGHDESDPTPDGMFATNFVEFFVCISLVFVDFSWCVRCIIAIRQQCFGKPFAAKWQTVSSRRGRFIAPAYMKTPTKWQTEMCVWWCENTYLMTWIYVFDNARIRARWIGPYAWRNVRNVLIICRLHIRHLKVWVLHGKRRPFAA